MASKKISVIVPIFNMEEYINRCIDSILNQTYQNIEVLLVNDGSTDSSKEIINDYASKDSRIIVIHKDNGGIGSAYKAAFEVMTGDYISFIDSDDWIELNMYEELVKIVEENEPDFVYFGATIVNNQGEKIIHHLVLDKIVEGNEEILSIHFNYLKHPTLARLFKRDLFDNVEVYEQNIGIDEMLIVQLLAKSKKAVFVPTSFYNVTPNANSVSRIKYTKRKIQEGIRIFRFICNFMELNNIKYAPIMDVRYLHYLLLINNIGYKNPELKKSREHLDAMKDLIIFYNKAKNSQVFKHEPWIYKILFHSFVVCRPIYHFINFFLDLRKKLVGGKSS